MRYINRFLFFVPLLCVEAAVFAGEVPPQDSLYSIAVKTIDNTGIDLRSFKGKRILIVVLPASAQDTSISITELSAIQARYQESLVVIGVPSEELGYSGSLKQQLKNTYSGQSPRFILTEGMRVKKSSGNEQSALFQWLTNKNKNRHFNQDVVSAGHKFFIDEKGELYAVLGAPVKLTHPLMDQVLSAGTTQKGQ